MDDAFISGLVKKVLVSAGSAAGSKVGGLAAELVLDLIGLDNNADLDAIKAQLDTMSAQITKTQALVSDLTKRVRWNAVTDGFDAIVATVATHNTNLTAFLSNRDQATRDAMIAKYLSGDTSLANLDSSLSLVHDRMMATNALTGTDGPLMQVYLETHWNTIWDPDPSAMSAKMLAVYTRYAQVQRLATTILVAYRQAQGLDTLATDARRALEPRLLAQYVKMVEVAPTFVMLNDLATAGLTIEFSSFAIAPNAVGLGNIIDARSGYAGWHQPAVLGLLPAAAGQTAASWTLQRVGSDPAAPNYLLGAVLSNTGGTRLQAMEQAVTHLAPPLLHIPSAMIAMADPSTVTAPLVFKVSLTEDLDVLRLTLVADGRTLGYIDHVSGLGAGGAGYFYELTATPATPANGLVTLSDFNRTPVVGRPTLRAYSRAYSKNAAGEGRFKPGYRVRYRVAHVSRFGESDRSDWVLAPKAAEDHQDAQGYFGNSDYYFPQIALAVDPAGRTEGYRVFRQFQGEAEEEVTAAGTFTGNPAAGTPVVFDDFLV